jgi:hypothetical protein
MNLTQMIDSVARKSYFSRKRQEVIEAINDAAQEIFHWIVKEQSGYFLKWDYSQVFTPPVTILDANITQGQNVLTSASAKFVAADVGTGISVAGAGPDGDALNCNIQSLTNGTTVVLSQPAQATIALGQATFRGFEYKLQPDVERIVRIREQDSTFGTWRIMHNTDFMAMSRLQAMFPQMFAGGASGSSTDSPFQWYGPYEKDDGSFYIQIEPPADENRLLEIVYNAQYVEIQSEGDYFMLPPEFRPACKNLAIADCLDPNNDDLADKYTTKAFRQMNSALVILRQKQISDPPKVGQYLADEDAGDDDNFYIPGSP